jgi:undecaprenyl-diphosphatase
LLQKLNELDTSLFLFFNGHHAAWLDAPMWYSSKMLVWIPVYFILLYSLFKKYGSKSGVVIIITVAITITICDRTSVEAFKEVFQRLRPSHQPLLDGKVHLLTDANGNFYKGGRFGFFSSHAANYFAVAIFYIILMRPMKRLFVVLVILWAAIIAYSRVYLGVHYPGDILAGALFGICVGWLMARLFLKVEHSYLRKI